MTNTPSNAAPKNPKQPRKKLSQLSYYEWTLIGLMILAVIGVGISHFNPQKSYQYWLAMVPIFGIACLSLEWSRLRDKGKGLWSTIKEQFIHWFSVVVSVFLIYLLFDAQLLNNQNVSLVVLLVLGLATFLAGIQLGWRLYLLGAFLWLILLMSAYLTNYLWLLILGGTLVLAIYIYYRIRTSSS